MKKIFKFALATTVTLGLTACGGGSSDGGTKPTTKVETEEPIGFDVSKESQVIYDADGITLTASPFYWDSLGYWKTDITIENNAEFDIYVSNKETIVNGYYAPSDTVLIDVPAGGSDVDAVSVKDSFLLGHEPDGISYVSTCFKVVENDNQTNEILYTEPITLLGEYQDAEITEPDLSYPIYEGDECAVYMLPSMYENEQWNYGKIYLYAISYRADERFEIEANVLEINGEEVSLSGYKRFDYSFVGINGVFDMVEVDFDNLGIESQDDIKTMTVQVIGSYFESGDQIFDMTFYYPEATSEETVYE